MLTHANPFNSVFNMNCAVFRFISNIYSLNCTMHFTHTSYRLHELSMGFEANGG